MNRDADDRAMRNLWETFSKEQRRSVLNTVFAVGCGIGIGIVVSLIMKWGAPIEVVTNGVAT